MSRPLRRHIGCFFGCALTWLASAACLLAEPSLAAEPVSLHARIDALLESTALGPLPPQADDAEFLRRVSLDFIGVIPTAAEARAFLDDQAADKRVKLVDRLQADPRYARWLSTMLDVTFMERRPDKLVKGIDFQNFLYQAVVENKPYNELVREILAADVVDGVNPPTARFMLDRDAEPNLLTRDIGRIFFGMDMQCAQCHDHPVVDDYYQADYYGLYAFVNRTFLFTEKVDKKDAKDKKAKKPGKLLAEKADGEVNFKSVFTGIEGSGVKPRLPKDVEIVEPVVAKGQEYFVAPEKDARPVPRFSRRLKLAELVSTGNNTAFNRNIVNRLWAHLMGRGLVHPLDFQHPDNPPSQPELLDLLAREFRGAKYDMKWFLRELALTRAYQRSCQLPSPEQIQIEPIVARLSQLEAAQAASKAAREAAAAEVDKLVKAIDVLKKPAKTPDAELAKLDAAAREAIVARDKAAKEAQDAKTAAAPKEDLLKLLSAAVAANQALIDKLPPDTKLPEGAKSPPNTNLSPNAAAANQVVVDAAKAIVERASVVRAEAEQARQQVDVLAKAAQAALAKATLAEQALAAAKNPAPPLAEILKLQAALQTARSRAGDATVAMKTCETRASDAKALIDYQRLAGSDRAAAERAWAGLNESWTNRGYVTTLKPLAPEQFGLSLMQAVGLLAAQTKANSAAIEKTPPDELKQAPDAQKSAIQARLVEQKTYDGARISLTLITNLYGGQPGQDFAATLNQALFFGNGPTVSAWLAPQTGSLVERLDKQSDPQAFAEDLYLSVFTRRPSDRETAEIADYLKDRKTDRLIAVQEVAWALLSSNEFRFNH